MKRWYLPASFGLSLLAGCSSDGRLTTKTGVAQLLGEMTFVAHEALIASSGARSTESLISVDCPRGGFTRVARVPDARGWTSFGFVGCNNGRNLFDGSVSARLSSDAYTTSLTYSGQLTSSGTNNGTLQFEDFLQRVLFPPSGDAYLFTMTLTGKMRTIDSKGQRTWVFDSQSYSYDNIHALTSPL
jgi:hypothetical protein